MTPVPLGETLRKQRQPPAKNKQNNVKNSRTGAHRGAEDLSSAIRRTQCRSDALRLVEPTFPDVVNSIRFVNPNDFSICQVPSQSKLYNGS